MLKRTLGSVPRGWIINYAFAQVDAAHGAGQSTLARRLRAIPAVIGAFRRWR